MESELDRQLKKYPRRFRESIRALVLYHQEKEYERGQNEAMQVSSKFVGQMVKSLSKMQI